MARKKGTTTTTRRPGRTTMVRRARRRRVRLRFLFLLFLVVAGALAWLVWPFWQLAGQFAEHPELQPSRLYGRAPILLTGAVGSVDRLATQLEAMLYQEQTSDNAGPGTFRRGDDWLEVHRRRFPTVNGEAGHDRLRLRFGGSRSGSRIAAVEIDGRNVITAQLDPPLIASYYGRELRERRPFESFDELPEDLIYSVLAIEDSTFLSHKGLSFKGMLRAAWNNLRRQRLAQGGSTLTQQLVKNLYLTRERTFVRKLREAVLAVLLEVRYDKRAIFRAYLNEIYWGRSGSVNLMGVGAASWAYFGKEPADLTLAESALLAGMIQSPSRYSPITAPERARERRDVVLQRLHELRWATDQRLEAARRQPVTARQAPLLAKHAPFFADAMAKEAERRFAVGRLRDTGFVLLSTLRPADQEAAEKAVAEGVRALEKGWEKGRGKPLQAALVSVDPTDGSLLAYVGGPSYGASQFDRVTKARRQPGSAFKPVVYAAALRDGIATPATIIIDEPLQVDYDGRSWSPKNSDGTYRGPVTARFALEKSLNVPTARLALRVGLPEIAKLARDMGITSRIQPLPALSLGSAEVTPLELATVYATLANGGRRPDVHGLEAVWNREGRRLASDAVAPPIQVLPESVADLVTDMLRGVLDRGTAAGARRQGLTDPLAGKTGTTNSRRDSWFAGYSPDRATLVWVGYDDNSTTRLSGARAALPIWTQFTLGVRPPGGYRAAVLSDGVVEAWIDPATGMLATSRCPRIVTERFLTTFPPSAICPEHPNGIPYEQPAGVLTPSDERHPFRRWIDRVRRRSQ